MPVLQPCSKALKLGVGLFVLSLFVWQLLESQHEKAVTKLNKTSLEALLEHLTSIEALAHQQPNHDGDEQRIAAAFTFISSGLVRHTAAAHARVRLERARKLAAAERQLRLALEASETVTSSGKNADLGLEYGSGVAAAVAAAAAAAEARAALKGAHAAPEPAVTFGVQLACGITKRCGLWQEHEPRAAAATAPATANTAAAAAAAATAGSLSPVVAQSNPAESGPGAELQSCALGSPPEPTAASRADGDDGAEGPAAATAAATAAAATAAAAAAVGSRGRQEEAAICKGLQQCDSAAAAVVGAAQHNEGSSRGTVAEATCDDVASASEPAAVAAAEEVGATAAGPAAPAPATLYRRAVGSATWLTSRLPPLLPLTPSRRFDLWYSAQVQLLALMPRYYLLLSPALAACGMPLPLLDWAQRRRLPYFSPLLQPSPQQPQPGPGLTPAGALGLGLQASKPADAAGAGAGSLGSRSSGGSRGSGAAPDVSGSDAPRQREHLLLQLPGDSDALAECRLEESASLWVLSASAANAGASVARAPQPQGACGEDSGRSGCCAGNKGTVAGASLTPLVLPLLRLPRRARRVVCNVTVSHVTAAALAGTAARIPGALRNGTQRHHHVFSFVVYEELDTFSRALTSVDAAVAAAAGSSTHGSSGSGSGGGSGIWLRSGAHGSGHGGGARSGGSRRAAYAAAAGMYGRAGMMAGWMRGGFHLGGGVLAGAWLPATAAAPGAATAAAAATTTAATADTAATDHAAGLTGRPDAERYWQLERERARRADREPPLQQPQAVFFVRWLVALQRLITGSDGATLYFCSSYLCDTTLFKTRRIAGDGSDGNDPYASGIGRGSVFAALQRGLLALLLPLLRMADSLLGLDWRALGGMAVAGWRLAAALGGPLLLPHLSVLRLLLPHSTLWQADVVLVAATGLICCYAECLLATRLLLRWRADVEDAAGVQLDTPTASIIRHRVWQEASGPRLVCWRRLLAWRGPLDGALVCAAVYHYSCSRAGAGLDPLLRLLLPLLCRWEQAKSLVVQAVYARLSAVEVATRASKQFIQVASTARLLHDSVAPLTLTQMAVVLEPDNRELWRLVTADDVRDAALPRTAAQHVLVRGRREGCSTAYVVQSACAVGRFIRQADRTHGVRPYACHLQMAMQRHRNGGRDRPQGAGQREQLLRERERERLRRQMEAAAAGRGLPEEEGSGGGARHGADVRWPPPIQVPDGTGPGGSGEVVAPRAFLCPITHDVMRQPCLLISPQLLSAPTYERSAIQTWLTLRQTDPRTNTALLTWILLPNDELFRCIDDWARGLEAAAVPGAEAAPATEAAAAAAAGQDPGQQVQS